MNVQGRVWVHKRPEKTSRLDLRLIFGINAKIIKPKTINRNKQVASSGKGGD